MKKKQGLLFQNEFSQLKIKFKHLKMLLITTFRKKILIFNEENYYTSDLVEL